MDDTKPTVTNRSSWIAMTSDPAFDPIRASAVAHIDILIRFTSRICRARSATRTEIRLASLQDIPATLFNLDTDPAFRLRSLRRQQHSVVRIGGRASRSHTLRSMPLLVLPRAAATRGQLLLTDQGGIVLFYAGICAQFRLRLHSVRRQAQSTSPT